MSEITTRDALIAACRANRECDIPRLVFADYLDETGSETDAARAIRIRHAVEYKHLQDFVTVSEWGSFATWDRGFIVAVSSTAEWWLQHGDDLVREHDVQRVQLRTQPDVELIGGGVAAVQARFVAYRDREKQIGVPYFQNSYLDGDAAAVERLLAAHWPGIQFVLPSRIGLGDPLRLLTWQPAVIEPRTFITGPV